jgi:hypothetical protein
METIGWDFKRPPQYKRAFCLLLSPFVIQEESLLVLLTLLKEHQQ